MKKKIENAEKKYFLELPMALIQKYMTNFKHLNKKCCKYPVAF